MPWEIPTLLLYMIADTLFLIFFLFSMRWRSIHEPSDGMLQAGAVALSFATIENMLYALRYGMETLLLRSFLSTTGHVMLALEWGFGFTAVMFGDTKRRARDYLRVFLFIYPAALLHGVSNLILGSGKPDIYFIFAAAVDIFALSLLVVARRRSPLRPMRLDEGKLFARAELPAGQPGGNRPSARGGLPESPVLSRSMPVDEQGQRFLRCPEGGGPHVDGRSAERRSPTAPVPTR